MSVRTRDWLKFISLVGIAFILGLAFESALSLPRSGRAAEVNDILAQTAAPRAALPAAQPAADLGDAFAAVAEHVKPAVVFIASEHRERMDARRLPPGFEDFLPQMRNHPPIERGSGSGFIVSADGYILTNNHVVAGADKVTVALLDKREFVARVVGTDPQTDIAVVKIDARDLPTVAFGNSDSTRIGEWALAIGNPLGKEFAFTVTAGIVSAKGRLLNGLYQGRYQIQDFIQTDAAINPGNSGGPLVNVHGQVIGINAAIASETGVNAGYGFAIPINLVRNVMSQLIASGHVERAVMGVGIEASTKEDADAVGLRQITGVVVTSLTDPSPAKEAGLELGDVIIALDGQPVDYVAQLQQRVGFKKAGEVVNVTILRRGGERKTIPVRLAKAPTETADEVASANPHKSLPNSDADRGDNALGIKVEPVSQEDAADSRLRLVARNGGGLMIAEVSPDGPAADKLIAQGEQGGPDIIVKVNDVQVRTRTEFRAALAKVKSGDVVELVVLRRQPDGSGWAPQFVRLRAQ
jgi:serine protease Do